MRLQRLLWLAGIVSFAVHISAQAPPAVGASAGAEATPRFELSLGYNFLRVNAPPGDCGCFSLNGGYGSIAVNVTRGVSVVADGSAAFAGNVDGTRQSMLLGTYLFGPRYSWRRPAGRIAPFGQAQFGGATELSNTAPVQHVSAFAWSLGGGVNVQLTHWFGLRAGEADWLHSLLPNGSNDRQNSLRVRSGILIRF